MMRLCDGVTIHQPGANKAVVTVLSRIKEINLQKKAVIRNGQKYSLEQYYKNREVCFYLERMG